MDVVFSNFGDIVTAFGLTLGLFVVSGIASMVWGTVLAVLRVGPVSILNKAAALYVTLFRNTPLLMIFIFMAIAMPKLGYTFKFVEEIQIGGWEVSAFFFRSCLALTLYTSAFVCEAMRSGVNAVSLGQAEAGRAIGLTFTQSMQLIVLPQAMRAVIPPLTSVQVALVKNTSVAAAFGMAEAVATMRNLANRHTDEVTIIFIAIAIGYIIIVEAVSLTSYAIERKVKVVR